MNILPRCRFLYIDNIRSFFVKLKLANILHTLDKHVYLFTCIQTLLILTLNTTCQTIIHVNISAPISLQFQTYHNIQMRDNTNQCNTLNQRQMASKENLQSRVIQSHKNLTNVYSICNQSAKLYSRGFTYFSCLIRSP